MNRMIHIGVAFLLVTGLMLVYAEPLAAMAHQWSVSPMYSYAYTVPLISLYLLWARRRELLNRPVRPARLAGLLIIAAALMLLVLGQIVAVQIAQQLSFVVMVWGVVLFLFGREHFKTSLPALLYLLFMVPFWDAFTEPLHQPFQNNSATLGVAILQAIGIPAHREGTVITLSNVTIEVARACSGVNYLIAVLALALPLSYLRLSSWSRRAVLIGSALLVASVANGLRVALICGLAHFEIGSPLHGPFHVLHGLFVAAVGYLVLFAGLSVLEKREQAARPAAPVRDAASVRASWRLMDAAVLATFLLTLAFIGTTPPSTPVALAAPLETLPRHFGTWTMDAFTVSEPARREWWRDADERLSRRYRRQDGLVATVDIRYFESQRQSHEMVDFRVADLHRQAVPRSIPLRDGVLMANAVRWPSEAALFWYELDGVTEADQYRAKLRSLWNMVSALRSNGAAIMLRAPAASGAGDEALASLQDLAIEVHAALSRHWPPRRSLMLSTSLDSRSTRR